MKILGTATIKNHALNLNSINLIRNFLKKYKWSFQKMLLKIPNKTDWGNYSDNLDTLYAYKKFGGKTNKEMQKYFKVNVVERAFEIRSMPLKPFQYYMLGLKEHIDSEDFGQFEESSATSCFIELVLDTLKEKPEYINPILDQLLSTLNYIAENQEYYEADIDIYGDFREKLKNIKLLAR